MKRNTVYGLQTLFLKMGKHSFFLPKSKTKREGYKGVKLLKSDTMLPVYIYMISGFFLLILRNFKMVICIINRGPT